MNRKTLFRAAKSAGWTGKSLDSLKEWAESEGIGEFRVGKSSVKFDDIDGIWAKTVTISVSADAGEDVSVEDGTEAEVEEMDEDEDVESKMEDEDETEGQKRAKAQVARQKKFRENQDRVAGVKRVNNVNRGGGIGFGVDAAKKNYDRAVNEGTRLTKTNMKPLFYSADRAEAFGASARLIAMDGKSYRQRTNDERIAAKAGLIGQNGTGGALVFNETLPELIENLEDYGVARQAIGVTAMRDGQQTVSKLGTDVSITDLGEAATLTESTPIFGNVDLVAGKTGVISKISSEFLNDSAFIVGDVIGRSILRSKGQFEDQSVFLGGNNRLGLANLVGATSTFDAALSSDWSDYTLSDIQDWLGKIPAWAWKDPNFAINCSLPFYMRVLRRFAQSAGGNTGAMLHSGVGSPIAGGILNGFDWDGIKVNIVQVLPQAYSANQLVAYAGAMSHATKFGVVTGSEVMDFSEQRYFDEDMVAYRMVQRWTFNGHDVNNTTNSGIVALQD